MYGGGWVEEIGKTVTLRHYDKVDHDLGVRFTTPEYALGESSRLSVKLTVGEEYTLIDVQDDAYDTSYPTGHEEIHVLLRNSAGETFWTQSKYLSRLTKERIT